MSLARRLPTGGYALGATDLHLIDRTRADPWVPNRRRELMRTVWYPAVPGVPRAYLGAFFDRFLKGCPQPLLRGPSPRHKVVGFVA